MAVPAVESSLQESRAATVVELPADVTAPFQIYVNGVLQEPGRDFRVDGDRLVFERPLAREGRLGFWRWASMFLGIAGTYRRNDSVDVVYERDGRRVVASCRPTSEPGTGS
jgi:hypothetical protein